ncbi:Fc.00g077030.m01.CDS01 [Cosmosporella sp. VM-42]
MALQRLLMRPSGVRAASIALAAPRTCRNGIRFSSTAPATIVDRGFWKSLVPKPLRKENRELRAKKAKEWNPATFFIAIFLLIGSMSIQMIALRSSFDRYMRQSEIKIGRLREVVEKIQNGEQVDVEKALGTGDPNKESDWEEMLKAIERDDAARKAQRQGKAKRAEAETKAAAARQIEEQESNAETTPSKAKTGSLGNFF